MDTIIYNARVQLGAAALNNLGIGAIMAGIVGPAVNGTVDVGHIIWWFILGVDLIALAQTLLGRLRT